MSMHIFTSITANYLPKARVLANSVKKFHPEAKFHLVISDDVPGPVRQNPAPFDSIITVNDLDIPDRKAWIFKHTVVEMCTAVKGFAFQEIFKRHKAEKIIYFDPDIAVMSRLDSLSQELDRASVLLTPHQTEPEKTLETIADNEICSLKHGIYNLGFLAVRTSAEGVRFVDWWAARLMDFCYDNIPGGIFTDQRWVDLAPAFFTDLKILRGPEYNVATWNLTHRQATGSLQQGILINGRPLCFYHFSGFDSGAQEIMLKKYGKTSPVLFDLREWYIAESKRLGQDVEGSIQCVYGFFDNKCPVTKEHRRLYRTREDLQKAFPDPFATADVNRSFYHWYQANAEKDGVTQPSVTDLQQQINDLRHELNLIRKSWLRWRIKRTYSKLKQHFRKPSLQLEAVPNEGP